MAAIRKPYFRKLYQFETISRGDYVPVKYIYPYYFVLEICFTSLEIDVVAVCLSFAVNKTMIGDVSANEFTLLFFLQCQLTVTTVGGQTFHFTRTHYSDSEPTIIYSYILMPCAQWRSNKNIVSIKLNVVPFFVLQFTDSDYLPLVTSNSSYSLWLDPTGDRTHNLPHPIRTR